MEPLPRKTAKKDLSRGNTAPGEKNPRLSRANRRDRAGGVQALTGGLLALVLAGGCGIERQDGVSPVSIGQDVALALGRQRLLIPIDPSGHYRATLTPRAGDCALLVASVCTLDPHRRVDEGDSHCLDQEVTTTAAGVSQAAVVPPERRFNALVLRVYSEGASEGPVNLRVDTE